MARGFRHFIVLVIVAAACSVGVGENGVTTAVPLPASTLQATTSPVTTSQEPSPITTSPVTTSPVTTSPAELDLPAPLDGRDATTIQVGARVLTVVIADDPSERAQGLMAVTDLRDLDGMLFVWPADGGRRFWMKDTPIPLDIAWFDSSGVLVGKLTMEPCVADSCQRYSPGADYRFAIETASGDLDFVNSSTRLLVADL